MSVVGHCVSSFQFETRREEAKIADITVTSFRLVTPTRSIFCQHKSEDVFIEFPRLQFIDLSKLMIICRCL